MSRGSSFSFVFAAILVISLWAQTSRTLSGVIQGNSTTVAVTLSAACLAKASRTIFLQPSAGSPKDFAATSTMAWSARTSVTPSQTRTAKRSSGWSEMTRTSGVGTRTGVGVLSLRSPSARATER